MNYVQLMNRAARHGWKCVGCAIIGNRSYPTMHRWQSFITIAIDTVTGRMFKVS